MLFICLPKTAIMVSIHETTNVSTNKDGMTALDTVQVDTSILPHCD